MTNFKLTKPSVGSIIPLSDADLAHPVERHLPKVDVAGSSPVIRSKKKKSRQRLFLFVLFTLLSSFFSLLFVLPRDFFR